MRFIPAWLYYRKLQFLHDSAVRWGSYLPDSLAHFLKWLPTFFSSYLSSTCSSCTFFTETISTEKLPCILRQIYVSQISVPIFYFVPFTFTFAWRAAVYWVAKSQTQCSAWTTAATTTTTTTTTTFTLCEIPLGLCLFSTTCYRSGPPSSWASSIACFFYWKFPISVIFAVMFPSFPRLSPHFSALCCSKRFWESSPQWLHFLTLQCMKGSLPTSPQGVLFYFLLTCKIQYIYFSLHSRFSATSYPDGCLILFLPLSLLSTPHSPRSPHISLTFSVHFPFLPNPPSANDLLLKKSMLIMNASLFSGFPCI